MPKLTLRRRFNTKRTLKLKSGNDTSQPTNGLTTPFASLTSAKWQQFGNTKLFIKVRAN